MDDEGAREALDGVPAIVLAGGRGTRLAAVLNDGQKVLAPVGERPFLAHVLDRLAAAGVRTAVLCTGYRARDVRAAFGATYGSLRLAYAEEKEPLGTGGAVAHALSQVAGDTVLVMNGDSLCTADLAAFGGWHRRRRAVASLLLTQVEDARAFGRVEVASDGRVLSFREKTSAEGPAWVSAGIYLVARALLEEIPRGRAVSLEHETLPGWIGRGLFGWQSSGRLLDIGTPQSYADAAPFLAAEGDGR